MGFWVEYLLNINYLLNIIDNFKILRKKIQGYVLYVLCTWRSTIWLCNENLSMNFSNSASAIQNTPITPYPWIWQMGDRWKTTGQAKGSKFQSEQLWNFSSKCCSISLVVYDERRSHCQMGHLLYWCKSAHLSCCSWRYQNLYQLQRCSNAYIWNIYRLVSQVSFFSGLWFKFTFFIYSLSKCFQQENLSLCVFCCITLAEFFNLFKI